MIPESSVPAPGQRPFLAGVFLIASSVLTFQIVQTRILSVISWYYLAFLAISIAMLGMTAGAVWVYLNRDRLRPEQLSTDLSNHALACAVAMPASLAIQLSLLVMVPRSLIAALSWGLLMVAMTAPYVFAGIAISLALTRSPFPASRVYGVDLLGAALGCAAVVGLLNLLDGPTAQMAVGIVAGLSAVCFAAAATPAERAGLRSRPVWRRPWAVTALLAALTLGNFLSPLPLRPVLVKDRFEPSLGTRYEKWNSYSRIVAYPPSHERPLLWGASSETPEDLQVPMVFLDIDGLAGTSMYQYDGTPESVEFLRYDMVNLAYNLPGIRKSAVIGVGGGRDILSAHLYGVSEIVGVELNPIFIELLTKHPVFSGFSGADKIPGLSLHVDDARSWFASTAQRFDLVQMSMIDTWAATGAGAFSLSENGLYTLEGWRAFLGTLTDGGIFTVSRWYNPSDVNETGRMIGLATAALLDRGIADARPHLFVASAGKIATLVLSNRPFRPEQLQVLRAEAQRLHFDVLLAPDQPPESPLLSAMVAAPSIEALNRAVADAVLDLSVPTDNRPFFFNQLRLMRPPHEVVRYLAVPAGGVVRGNLFASIALLLILVFSIAAVVTTILYPLRNALRTTPRNLVVAGTSYFALIGLGFMLAEISLLQYFSVYLGHPIYSLGVCLFALILATGMGSLASGRFPMSRRAPLVAWALSLVAYLLVLQHVATDLFAATTAQPLAVRICVSLAVILPLGFLMGFAFPTGMRLVEAVDPGPTPWFWGVNGATGVLASVLAVMVSMGWGIDVTMTIAAFSYLALIAAALYLTRLPKAPAAARGS